MSCDWTALSSIETDYKALVHCVYDENRNWRGDLYVSNKYIPSLESPSCWSTNLLSLDTGYLVRPVECGTRLPSVSILTI